MAEHNGPRPTSGEEIVSMNPYRENVIPAQTTSFVEQLRNKSKQAEERFDRERAVIAKWLLEEIKKTALLASAYGKYEVMVANGKKDEVDYESCLQKAQCVALEQSYVRLFVRHPAFDRQIRDILNPLLKKEGFAVQLLTDSAIVVSWKKS